MQTSYAFISLFKKRVSDLDRVIHPSGDNSPPPSDKKHGPVEYRKLLQRFRQFLAEEDKFWSQLIVRLSQIYSLSEVHPTLSALNLIAAEGLPVDAGSALSENSPALFPPRSPEERSSGLAVIAKAVVCLGDIARYKEQYNESGGRPRAGKEDGPPATVPRRGGKNKRGGGPRQTEVTTRERNYERAQRCYEQGRLLLPTEGNASHQLAILATYKRDGFTALLHYYRSLCVRTPYDTAEQNMSTLLRKNLEAWKAKKKDRRKGNATSSAPEARINALKEDVVVLHALWQSGDRWVKCTRKEDTITEF
jgi:protein SMG7